MPSKLLINNTGISKEAIMWWRKSRVVDTRNISTIRHNSEVGSKLINLSKFKRGDTLGWSKQEVEEQFNNVLLAFVEKKSGYYELEVYCGRVKP